MSVSRGLFEIFTRSISISLLIGVSCFAVPANAQNPLKKIAAMMPSGQPAAAASYSPSQTTMAPTLKMPQIRMPQMQMPQMQSNQMASVPQMNLPQMQMPQMQMPNVQMQMPRMPQFPKLPIASGQNGMANFGQTGPMGLIDKWNNSVANFVAKTKQKLTIPPMKTPQLKLPFTGQSGGSIFPSLAQPPATNQPPTLQNWLGQPRPQ